LKSLYCLYSSVIKISFRSDLKEEEVKAITSIIGTMIFAKKPLNDNVVIVLLEVKSWNILWFIQRDLVSIINKDPILHFHHYSFIEFILSFFFSQNFPEFSAVQDQDCHKCQLAMLYLNTIVSSVLHFNICGLKTSDISNRNIPATNKSAISPLLLYSCQFWADYLVCIPCMKILMEVVQFMMYVKLLFWIEMMSISRKAHETITILKKTLE